MKKLIPALITILVLLSMSLTVYAQSEDLLIMPAKQSHWSQSYVDYLNENYGTDDFFSGKNLDEYITVDDFTSLIKLTVDRNYAGRPDSTARQARGLRMRTNMGREDRPGYGPDCHYSDSALR